MSHVATDLLSRAAFMRLYFAEEIACGEEAEMDALPLTERLDLRAHILDRIFGPEDAALRQRLFPRLVPPLTFDDEDRAAARALLGSYAHLSLDEQPGRQVLESAAARRRLPPNLVVELRFPGDYTWRIDFDPAPAIHHALSHPDLAEPLTLGYRDPHFHLPILRWPEVFALAPHLAPRERPLLLSTAWLSPDDDRAAVATFATRTLREAHVIADPAIEELAERMLQLVEIRWRRDPARGWINDGDHSARNPENEDLDDEGFARVRAFLEAAGAG